MASSLKIVKIKHNTYLEFRQLSASYFNGFTWLYEVDGG